MAKANKTRVHPEIFKLYSSPIYRGKIKRMVESIKTLRDIPHGQKLPGNLNRLPATATDKDHEKRNKIWATRIERSTAHYWAQTIEVGMDRRVMRTSKTESEE